MNPVNLTKPPEPVPPGSYRLVADIDSALVEQVFDLPQRQGEADIHHDRQADDLGRGLEIKEWIAHPKRLRNALHCLELFCSDTAVWGSVNLTSW